MLKTHEILRAMEIREELTTFGVELTEEPIGPYGRVLEAIEAYRDAGPGVEYHEIPSALLRELICIFAVGIVRGDGAGVQARGPDDYEE